MSNRISRIRQAQGTLGPCLTGRIFLTLVLGFIIVQHAIVKAQDPGPGAKSAPYAPAPSTAPAPPSPAPLSDEYLINPDDVLDVYVYDVPELSHTYTVSPSGAVTVPLLPKPLQAAGLTPDQFARAMEEAFRQLRSPEAPGNRRLGQTITNHFGGCGRGRKESAGPLRDGANQIGRYSHSMWWVSRRRRD